jgi:hypothetical protein
MRSYSPSGADDLLGMEMDFVGHLSGLPAVDAESVTVRRTDDPQRLIEAECAAARGHSVEEATEAVTQAWLGKLGYVYSEAHHVTASDELGTLEGVTQIGPGGFFVTCRVTVRPSSG